LPLSLIHLVCNNNNQLTYLPELPPSLRGLWCDYNVYKTKDNIELVRQKQALHYQEYENYLK
jgi:hypothetical protein